MATPMQQSVSDLTFHVFNRSLHPELFTIYSARKFLQGDYEVTIWLTGCSHVVSVYNQGHCISEALCHPDQMLPSGGLMEKLPVRGHKSHQCRWSNDYKYINGFQVETADEKLYRHMHGDLLEMARKRGIFVSFPQWATGDLTPFSYLDYEARHDEMHMLSFHCFPDYQTIIKTQSIFSMRKAAARI